MTPAVKGAIAALTAAAIDDLETLDGGSFVDVQGARLVLRSNADRADAVRALLTGEADLVVEQIGGFPFEAVRWTDGRMVLVPRERKADTAKSRRRRAAA